MANSDNSKSISGSHTIPFTKPSSDVWVKDSMRHRRLKLLSPEKKVHGQKRDDWNVCISCSFHDMTAFSPPADSWIIQYPKKDTQDMKKPIHVPEAEQLENPCRQYITTSDIPVKSNKSLGTDDHFKSAACSKNLLKVCEKLMTNKEFLTNANDSADDDFGELSLMHEKSRMDFYRQKHGNRRGSQSAPVSPKLERRALPEAAALVSHNPYFTVSKQEPRTESNIGFLTSLFGITAAKPAEAKANLTHKYEQDYKLSDVADDASQSKRKITLKPNDYREMNIFSPTSG